MGALEAPTVDASNTIPFSLAWQHNLDDAPCGVAEASPVAFNDNGTAAVEVGDRQGDLYAFGISTGAVPTGWNTATGTAVGDRKSTRLNSSHIEPSRMPSSA